AEPDPARSLRQRRQEHLWAGRVADLCEEVLLGEPEVGEPGVLRGHHVLQVVPEDVPLGLLAPGFGDLELAQQSEFHVSTLPTTCDHTMPRSVDLDDQVQVLVDEKARVGPGDDRRLALFDDGGATALSAGRERIAVVDRAGREARLWEVDLPRALVRIAPAGR